MNELDLHYDHALSRCTLHQSRSGRLRLICDTVATHVWQSTRHDDPHRLVAQCERFSLSPLTFENESLPGICQCGRMVYVESWSIPSSGYRALYWHASAARTEQNIRPLQPVREGQSELSSKFQHCYALAVQAIYCRQLSLLSPSSNNILSPCRLLLNSKRANRRGLHSLGVVLKYYSSTKRSVCVSLCSTASRIAQSVWGAHRI